MWLLRGCGCGGECGGTGRYDTSTTSIITTRFMFTCGMDPVLIYSITTTTTSRIINTKSINIRGRICYCHQHHHHHHRVCILCCIVICWFGLVWIELYCIVVVGMITS